MKDIEMIHIDRGWSNKFPDDSSYQFMQINVVSFVEGLLSLLWPYEYKCIQVKPSKTLPFLFEQDAPKELPRWLLIKSESKTIWLGLKTYTEEW
jgi:hypothetical protein